ncbi:50S ribosomal protein L24e [Halalkalicoccus ordinarius]|uniref:50S ribosomal protein L24e n=1 Tax=Halalkalicoccus ordinarius TaxID=3116651 RepID=UPI00300EE625
MVETRTCDYSGEEIEPGTGIMYVRTDGTVLHFVDSKAEKNYRLGREARDLEWTAAGRNEKAGRARTQEKRDAKAESTAADAGEPGTEAAATVEEATVETDEETAEEVTADDADVDSDAGAEQAESVEEDEDEPETMTEAPEDVDEDDEE